MHLGNDLHASLVVLLQMRNLFEDISTLKSGIHSSELYCGEGLESFSLSINKLLYEAENSAVALLSRRVVGCERLQSRVEELVELDQAGASTLGIRIE